MSLDHAILGSLVWNFNAHVCYSNITFRPPELINRCVFIALELWPLELYEKQVFTLFRSSLFRAPTVAQLVEVPSHPNGPSDSEVAFMSKPTWPIEARVAVSSPCGSNFFLGRLSSPCGSNLFSRPMLLPRRGACHLKDPSKSHSPAT